VELVLCYKTWANLHVNAADTRIRVAAESGLHLYIPAGSGGPPVRESEAGGGGGGEEKGPFGPAACRRSWRKLTSPRPGGAGVVLQTSGQYSITRGRVRVAMVTGFTPINLGR
jgi:hypothetical protein